MVKMIEITLDTNENRTVKTTIETIHVTNCLHLQNKRDSPIFWSTSEFSDTNTGFELKGNDERYFSEEQDIYIKGNGVLPISVQLSNTQDDG